MEPSAVYMILYRSALRVCQDKHRTKRENIKIMEPQNPKNYFIDMDGVLMRGAAPIPGAPEFIGKLKERGANFLLLTNNSMYTPRDLRLRLERSGLQVPAGSIYTSAMATARFLHSQHPEG